MATETFHSSRWSHAHPRRLGKPATGPRGSGLVLGKSERYAQCRTLIIFSKRYGNWERNVSHYTRVYRCLFNPDLFLMAYAKIYRNQGAMTPGTEDDTVDGMSEERIEKSSLRCERNVSTFVHRVAGMPTRKMAASDHSVCRTLRKSWCRRCCGWCWKPTTNPGSKEFTWFPHRTRLPHGIDVPASQVPAEQMVH